MNKNLYNGDIIIITPRGEVTSVDLNKVQRAANQIIDVACIHDISHEELAVAISAIQLSLFARQGVLALSSQYLNSIVNLLTKKKTGGVTNESDLEHR